MDALVQQVKALPGVKQRIANALIGALVADAAGMNYYCLPVRLNVCADLLAYHIMSLK